MENSIEQDAQEPKKVDIKVIMNLGLVYGLIMVMLSLLSYILDLNNEVWFALVIYAIYGVVIFYLQKYLRDQVLGGYIAYGKALGSMIHISVYASLILALYMFVLVSWIDPGIIDDTLQQTYDRLLESGLTPTQAEKQMENIEKGMTPGVMTVTSIVSTIVMTLILALITSAIVKKEEPLFG